MQFNRIVMRSKFTDDYSAKFRLFARSPKIVSMPVLEGLPKFASKKFSNYDELNAWKRQYLMEIASRGGCRWRS